MIKLFDNYGVVVDEYNYMLVKRTGDRTMRGKVYDRLEHLGYYTSLADAIRGLRAKYIRRELQNGVVSLGQALVTIEKCDAKFEQLLREKCGEEGSEK